MMAASPWFPCVSPHVADPLWFSVDKPCDDESELTQLEKDYQNWLNTVSQKDSEIIPIGKTASENFDDEDEEEEEDDNEDDESESNDDEDDEIDGDEVNYEQDSPMFH